MRGRIGSRKARAAEHRVDAVMQRIGPDAAPEQLQRALAAIALGDAGAAELEETLARMARDQRADIEFAGAVETEIRLGDLLPQQAIGADDRRPSVDRRHRAVDDDQVVADPVEAADVAPDQAGGRIRARAALLEEDADSAAFARGGFPSSWWRAELRARPRWPGFRAVRGGRARCARTGPWPWRGPIVRFRCRPATSDPPNRTPGFRVRSRQTH